MLELLLGSVLAVAALGFVLAPLLRGGARAPARMTPPVVSPESTALDALREIEFDRETGKLSDADYESLKATYTPRALAEMRAREAGAADAAGSVSARGSSSDAADDAAEALIARARARALTCATCGPRPESDALFCSDCGRYLGAECLRCGAAVDSTTARFCGECGETLAA